MKKLLVLITGLVMGAGISAQQVNDPNAEVREAKNYHGISVSNAFDIYLSQSSNEAVAVSAATTKDRETITVEVKDGILYIGIEKGLKWTKGDRKLKAYISFKQIDKLNVSGACDVFISGTLKADKLSIHQSGASDLKGKLDVKELTVDISGASDIMVSGMAGKLDVEASGASDFKGFDLVTDYCDVRASGASGIRITVNKELSAHASGASDIKYKGDGLIRDLKTGGASSVSRSRS
jgi:Putative auto-transporter adhesin, head GIN domain